MPRRYSMDLTRPLLLLALVAGAAPLHAKGLNDLAPKSAVGKDAGKDAREKAGEKADPKKTAEDSAKAPAPLPPSELSLKLKDQLFVATSYGLVMVRQGSASWFGSGMTDLSAYYRLKTKLAAGALFASLRYAPAAVAPRLDRQPPEAYNGVMEALLGGVRWQKPWQRGWQLAAGAELGLLRLTSGDQLGVPYHKPPRSYGFLAALSGAAHWEFSPHLTLGPQLRVSAGTFTLVQLSAQATFAF